MQVLRFCFDFEFSRIAMAPTSLPSHLFCTRQPPKHDRPARMLTTTMSSKRSTKQEQDTTFGVCKKSPAKRRKTLAKASPKKQDEAEQEDDVLTSIMPLRLTALGGYLPLKDVGRFLLRVSKDMTASIFEGRISLGGDRAVAVEADGSGAAIEEALRRRRAQVSKEVWKCLCEQKWKPSNSLDNLLSAFGCVNSDKTDWENLFRKFIPSAEKPPARASVEDYSLMLSLYQMQPGLSYCSVLSGSSAPELTYFLKGDDAARFLKDGESGWLELGDSVKIGTYECADDLYETCSGWSDPLRYIISAVHVIRKSDGKSCELDRQSFVTLDHKSEGHAVSEGFVYTSDMSERVHVGKLNQILGTSLSWELVSKACRIRRRLRTVVLQNDDGSVEHYLTHIDFTAMIRDHGEGEYEEKFSDLEHRKEDVTVADFIEQLDVEWK